MTQAQSAVNIPVKMPLIGSKLDLAYFWQSWLNYQAPVADKTFAFHCSRPGLLNLRRTKHENTNANTIVLSGGVMHNQLLRRLLEQNLGNSMY